MPHAVDAACAFFVHRGPGQLLLGSVPHPSRHQRHDACGLSWLAEQILHFIFCSSGDSRLHATDRQHGPSRGHGPGKLHGQQHCPSKRYGPSKRRGPSKDTQSTLCILFMCLTLNCFPLMMRCEAEKRCREVLRKQNASTLPTCGTALANTRRTRCAHLITSKYHMLNAVEDAVRCRTENQ
jgi:hypothetical protein